MVSTASINLPHILGYSIVEQLYTGSKTAVYRALSDNQQHQVVIKVLQREYPNFSELVQFRNQYTITKNLGTAGIVRPLSLEPWRNSLALVMEDVGGLSLKQYAQDKSLDGLEVLAIARQLADILHDLTQDRVVHKDIKPANILICPQSKQVKLIDFSIASLLPKETQELKNPNVLEGTLAYLAPEQTGRMNRGIDYRTDFYGLGVTLYELLSGQLPFPCDDPLELVHCHIAQQPIPPHQINPNIPAIVSQIVLKLMAKNAEDRYQSALGLKYDLEKCWSQAKETGTVAAFELAQRDISDRFLIPEKLYGRETEVQTLLDAFERVAEGNTEFMLVAGFSGIGKTAVVNEVHKPIVRQRGYFIKGKFDQFNRNIPFSALVQAFRDLMGQLFTESDAQLQQWKSKILDAVGVQGQVMIEVIPELEKIIGKQPAVPELSGTAAQNRFNLLFGKFIQVFTTAYHPLVIFLDDLQWADSASLNLMKLLIAEAETGYLLLIGAYRDNEVFPAHPLMLTLDQMRKAEATINTITLTPLSQRNINHLAADTLSCDGEVAKPLTELVYQKTKGNPFFTTQFLLGLYEEGLIKFDWAVGYWECDIVQVRQRALTDDVVDFMAGRLQKLPEKTQQVLKLAACIGNQFDLATLAIVSEQSKEDVADSLWQALQSGFICPKSQVYKFYLNPDDARESAETTENVQYRFLHDRVQQAAYSLIPDVEKETTHYQIGKLLLQQVPLDSQTKTEQIFKIVNQLNQGKRLIFNQKERDELANLNLIACQKSRMSTAYEASSEYAETGISLLGEEAWQRQYKMNLSFHELKAELAFLQADFNVMEKYIKIVLERAKSLLEKVNVYCIRISSKVSQNKPDDAVAIAEKILKQFNITFPKNPDQENIQEAFLEIDQLTQGREIEELIDLPIMVDKQQLAIMQIISAVIPAAYVCGSTLFPFLIALAIKLSIQHGNAGVSAFIYVNYGILACNLRQDIVLGIKLGQLALQVIAKLETKAFKAEVLHVVGTFLLHRKFHLKETLPRLQNSYIVGLELGNLEFLGFTAGIFCVTSFLCNQSLANLENQSRSYFNMLIQLNQVLGANWCKIILKLAVDLLKVDDSDKIFQEEELQSQLLSGNDIYGLYLFYWCKLIRSYLLEETEKAQAYAAEIWRYSIAAPGTVVDPTFYFYDSLTALATLAFRPEDQSKVFHKVEENQMQLKQFWASHAPMNHQHKVDLVEAEKYRILGQKTEAIELYDKAIAGAKENEYISEVALANELAAKFYLNWGYAYGNLRNDGAQPNGKEKVAAGYMQEAYYCYARWGAKAKTDDLEQRYPNLLRPILQQAGQTLNPLETLSTLTQSHLSINSSITTSRSSTTSINNTLDFAAILKASQSLSGTIELDELLTQLAQIILQNSGGDRCALIIPNTDREWYVEAIATLEKTELCSQPLENHPNIPIKLIQYVKNTQEVVVVNDLKTDLPVIGEYLLAKQPKSVLCLPILNQGSLIGIVSLTNQSTIGAFTTERILILNFLCTQAAISLENARLYQQSQAYAQKLEESQLQIVQSEKMASLGNLMAGVAHEINNPLGFLNGSIANVQENLQDLIEHLELYQKHYPDAAEPIQENAEEIDLEFLCEDTPKLLNSMESATERIKNISTSLRTFSRADTEYRVSANLHEGIDSTLMILKYRLKANQNRPAIQVIKNYGEFSQVECFPGQLNQVFMNIIANAIDVFDEAAQDLSYTSTSLSASSDLEAQPHKITIKTARLTEENAVEIRIGDNGKGMPPEVKERIFDHLFTTKGVGKGTGLGLAIARQIIVEKHGGSLEVYSSLGQGTQFCIRLPVF